MHMLFPIVRLYVKFLGAILHFHSKRCATAPFVLRRGGIYPSRGVDGSRTLPRSGQDRSLQAARSRHFVGRGLDPSGRVRREQSGVLPRRGGFHIRPGRSRHHEPPREG